MDDNNISGLQDQNARPLEDLGPLEQLATISLDAADAANDSAEAAQVAISKLEFISSNVEDSLAGIRRTPLILAAMILGVGVALGVTIAVVMTRLSERVDGLNASIVAQKKLAEEVKEGLKNLSQLEANLKKFEGVASDTTQRAVVTLREQVKTDRLAAQQLEVRRINELIASLKGTGGGAIKGAGSAPSIEEQKLIAIEKSVRAIEGDKFAAMERSLGKVAAHVDEIQKSLNQGDSKGSSAKAQMSALDGHGKELRAMKEEVSSVKQELGAIHSLLEKRSSEPTSTAPSFKRQ